VTSAHGWVDIHYLRPPDRETIFRQQVVHRDPEVVVTYLASADIGSPMRIGDRVVLEPGSPVVWFTYPDRWHDIGRFHTADGVFTGIYANVLTPVRMSGSEWRTTDLCLDVWAGADGTVEVLDEDDLRLAERNGWIDAPTAARARHEAGRIADQARTGAWPPPHVHHWTLARTRELIDPRPS